MKNNNNFTMKVTKDDIENTKKNTCTHRHTDGTSALLHYSNDDKEYECEICGARFTESNILTTEDLRRAKNELIENLKEIFSDAVKEND